MAENIKSIFILKKIFNIITNKKKLKIIRYNKKIQTKLNIKIVDYKKYETLKEFNKKFGLNINDINIKELDLRNRKIGNEGLKFLKKFQFEFKELEVLNLSYNKITDIQILENIQFKKLKELNLSNNDISDINVLEKKHFEKLEKLDLSFNHYLSSVKILEKVNFKQLNKLY